MPRTEVLFYRTADGQVPVRQWLREVLRVDRRAHAKCVAKIERLAERGHELRRPESDYLRDGIHELRVRRGHVNYRILYFFQGRHVAVLAHALIKESIVPDSSIDRAFDCSQEFAADPVRHTAED